MVVEMTGRGGRQHGSHAGGCERAARRTRIPSGPARRGSARTADARQLFLPYAAEVAAAAERPGLAARFAGVVRRARASGLAEEALRAALIVIVILGGLAI